MVDRTNGLSRVEADLRRIGVRRGKRLLDVWGRECPLLVGAGLGSPSAVPEWVWTLGRDRGDAVIRALVGFAQSGDEVAGLVVLACLRPGVCALAGRIGVPVDEIVSEVAAVMLEFPLVRRRSVAGQILLDARNRLGRRRVRTSEFAAGDTRCDLERLSAPGAMGVGTTSGEQVMDLVGDAWRSGQLRADGARLVLETRVFGVPVAAAAARRGIGAKAAFERRRRAEHRLRRIAATA